MDYQRIRKRFLPMTETMFYILLSLREERHGYGIMQHVKGITGGKVVLGAGTIYQSLAKLESDGLIKNIRETESRKIYLITKTGDAILREEAARIKLIYNNLGGLI